MRKYAKKSRARKSTKRPARKVLSKPAARQVKAIVKKALDVKIEDKFVTHLVPYSFVTDASGNQVLDGSGNATVHDITLIDGPIGGYNSTSRSSFQRILPTISQGTDVGQRIGNKISVKSCTLKLVISTLGTFAPSFETVLRVMLVSPREIKSYAIATGVIPPPGAPPTYSPSPVPYGDLLQNGAFTVQYGQDVPVCNMLPINTSKFIVHYDKLVHFMRSTGYNYNLATSPQIQVGTVDSAGGQRKYFTATIKVPLAKTLMYDNIFDEYPTNACPLLCIGNQNMDDTHSNPNMIGFHALTKLYYEDA